MKYDIYKPLPNLRDEPPNRWAMAHRLVRPCKVDSQLWCSCGMGDWMSPHCPQKRTNVLFGRKGGATFTRSIYWKMLVRVLIFYRFAHKSCICNTFNLLCTQLDTCLPLFSHHHFPPKAPGWPTSFAWSESSGWPPTVLVEHPSSHLHSYPAAAARAQPLRSWCHHSLEAVPNPPWLFGAWNMTNTSTSSEVGGAQGSCLHLFGVGGANQNKLLRITYFSCFETNPLDDRFTKGFSISSLEFLQSKPCWHLKGLISTPKQGTVEAQAAATTSFPKPLPTSTKLPRSKEASWKGVKKLKPQTSSECKPAKPRKPWLWKKNISNKDWCSFAEAKTNRENHLLPACSSLATAKWSSSP